MQTFQKTLKVTVLAVAAALLAACGSTNTKQVPNRLTEISAEVQPRIEWQVRLGGNTNDNLQPVLVGTDIFASTENGYVVRIDAPSGTVRWQVSQSDTITAGVGVGADRVVYVTKDAQIVALDINTGKEVWRVTASSQVFTPPVIANGVVAVKSVDNWIQGFNAQNGNELWGQQRVGPSLSLRGLTRMLYAGGLLFLGTSAGELTALTIEDGVTRFNGTVAYPKGVSDLERMTDVVGGPMIGGNTICAVAFQGRLSCFNLSNGDALYSRDFAGINGLFVLPQVLFATTADAQVQAFYTENGNPIWKQDQLQFRQLTAPSIANQSIVVGDFEGVLHFLRPADGKIIGRQFTDGSRVTAHLTPVPKGTLAQTSSGSLYFVTLP